MLYMDNAAIQKPKKECIEEAVKVWNEQWGNASSQYDFGIKSRQIVENVRKKIANTINCNSNEIIFCSSGSEANSLAIDGFINANNQSFFITTTIEHPSISTNIQGLKYINCYASGKINLHRLKTEASRFKNKGVLFSIQMGNSEIGTIQDIKSIARIIHENRCFLHVDGVQAFGHIPVDVKDLDIDMFSATSQKIGGIPGAAFLYVKSGITIRPIIHGKQEKGLRGGTYNVGAIASFGKAIDLIDFDKQNEIKKIKEYLCEELVTNYDVILVGDILKNRLPNNLSLTFNGYNADVLITLLSDNEIYVSAGSACSSFSRETSKILTSIGLSVQQANSTIRITLSEDITRYDCDIFVKSIGKILCMLDNINEG